MYLHTILCTLPVSPALAKLLKVLCKHQVIITVESYTLCDYEKCAKLNVLNVFKQECVCNMLTGIPLLAMMSVQ